MRTEASFPTTRLVARSLSRQTAVILAGSLALAILALSGDVQAQESRNLALPRFNPAAAGDRFFGLPAPDAPGNLALRGGLLLDYARNPLIINDSDGTTVGRVVEHQMLLHLNVALALADRIGVNLDLPLALVNRGDGTFEAGTFTGSNAFTSPKGGGIGDLRLGARLRLFGENDAPVQIAVGGYLWLPTGSRNDFLTDAALRGQVHAIGGGRIDRFIWTAMVGPTLRSSQSYGGVRIGSQISWGAGAGVLLGQERQVQLGVETAGGVTVANSTHSTNSEALLGLKVRVLPPIELGLGAGRGFARGLGTPDLRGIFSLFYTPAPGAKHHHVDLDRDGDGVMDPSDACPQMRGQPSTDPTMNGCPPAADSDGDGIVDSLDACPREAGAASQESKENGCPPRDTDKDGLADKVDACPTVPGPASDDAKKNGCPPPADGDGDGVADGEDACPRIAGIKTGVPSTNGCPGDADNDGFRDDQDACPHEKGVESTDPTKRGCPRLVRVTAKEIVILEQIQFATNEATIKSESDALVSSIAQVMQEHPELLGIEVQGHTDSQGKRKRNQGLSQSRADAVVKALVAQGVAGGRLSAKGFGQDAPIASNDSADGRQQNRRVQFVIMAKNMVKTPASEGSPARTEP